MRNLPGIRHQIRLHYKLSFFGIGDYENSLKWLNKILSRNQNEVRPDLFSFAHILNLIVHFELDNIVLLEYTVKNSYCFLYKRKKFYKVENAVLNFKRRAYRINSKEKLKELFTELSLKITEITKDPYEKIALEYFDLLFWLESKIENKKFADVVKVKTETVKVNCFFPRSIPKGAYVLSIYSSKNNSLGVEPRNRNKTLFLCFNLNRK